MKFFIVSVFAILLASVACQNDQDVDIEALINGKFKDLIPEDTEIPDAPEVPDVPEPEVDPRPVGPEVISEKIDELFERSAEDTNTLCQKVINIINNAITQAIDGTENSVWGEGGIARVFTTPVKAIISAISSTAQGINTQIVNVVKVPVTAAIGAAENVVKQAANAAVQQVQQMSNCGDSEEASEIESRGYEQIAECIPNHVVDSESIGHLLDDVYDYTDFITKVPQSAHSCIGNGLAKAIPCIGKLGAQIPIKTAIIGPKLGKDGVQIGLSYTRFGVEVARCFTRATVQVAKDFANNGVNIAKCLA